MLVSFGSEILQHCKANLHDSQTWHVFNQGLDALWCLHKRKRFQTYVWLVYAWNLATGQWMRVTKGSFDGTSGESGHFHGLVAVWHTTSPPVLHWCDQSTGQFWQTESVSCFWHFVYLFVYFSWLLPPCSVHVLALVYRISLLISINSIKSATLIVLKRGFTLFTNVLFFSCKKSKKEWYPQTQLTISFSFTCFRETKNSFAGFTLCSPRPRLTYRLWIGHVWSI